MDVVAFYLSGKYGWWQQHQSFQPPLRYVHAAQRTGGESRLIILGHLDPQVETYRTDAPTTSWVAVQITVTIAGSMHVSNENS